MRLKFSFILFAILQFGFLDNLHSQEINLGGRVPDMTLANVINYPEKELKLTDFNGKLIILDFWGIYCSACIASFPELDSLQTKYRDKIQIIAVNKDSKDATIKFLNKHSKINLPPIPFVTSDSVLESFFPHIYVPHHVWIDSNKIVRFITNGYNTSAQTIGRFLEGKDVELAEKKDVSDFDFDKPFILEGNGRWFDKVEYYSYIMHNIPGVNTGFHYEKNNNGSVHLYSTSSILELFKIAFSNGSYWKFLSKNEIVLKTKKPQIYDIPNNADIDEWKAKYYFIYDLLLPAQRANQLYSIMREDLERYFGVNAMIERRQIKCLALIKTSDKDKLAFTNNKSEILRRGMIADSLWGEWNGKIYDFVISLNLLLSTKYPLPVVDETNYSGKICLGLNKDKVYSKNLDLLRSELKKYDLDLVEKVLTEDVLVLKETKYKTN